MQLFLDNPALRLFTLTSALLAVELVLLAGWTGTVRVMQKAYVIPEDAVMNKVVAAAQEHDAVARVKRAHMNLLENLVPFFIVGLAYALSGATAFGAAVYYFTFLGARLLHALFTLRAMQPFRTIAFAVGVFAIVGMAVHVIRASI